MVTLNRTFFTSLIITILLVPLDSLADKASELESLRIKIKDVETRIKGAQDESEKLRKELRDNEITTAETLTRLHDIENKISQKRAELQELGIEAIEYEKTLEAEKQILAQQIRSAYRVGRNDYIKLILNQEDPLLMGRALAYYDYHNRARTTRIKNVTTTLSELTTIQSSIESETEKLQGLKSEHEKKLSDFHEYRASRYDIITRLQEYIDEQGVELHTLQENERELGKLFKGLKEEETVSIEMFEDMPPFNTLKGRLDWPVKGKLLKRFGNTKKGGNLKWQGVLIDAETGTSV